MGSEDQLSQWKTTDCRTAAGADPDFPLSQWVLFVRRAPSICLNIFITNSAEYGPLWRRVPDGICAILCDEILDQGARVAPYRLPNPHRLAPFRGNPVIAPRRAGIGGHNPTGQEARSGQRSQHRINRTVLEDRDPAIGIGQEFGDLIAIQIVLCLIQDPQQNQGCDPPIEGFLEAVDRDYIWR